MLKLLSSMALGWIHQLVMMAPKKVPMWFAWSGLGLATLVLYWWATPEAMTQFRDNWRYAIVGVVQFFLAARGTGSVSERFKLAPRTNSL